MVLIDNYVLFGYNYLYYNLAQSKMVHFLSEAVSVKMEDLLGTLFMQTNSPYSYCADVEGF